MVTDWYKALDVHEPQYVTQQYVSEAELEMVFPEATLRSMAEFELLAARRLSHLLRRSAHHATLDVKLSPDGSYGRCEAGRSLGSQPLERPQRRKANA